MRTLMLAIALALPVASHAADPAAEIAAEVEKGVKAYNTQDIKYYETALAPEAVYIAEDGATIAGKDRVVRLFTRIFAGEPKRQLAVEGVSAAAKGEVGWARFKWTLTIGSQVRKGVGSTLFARSGDRWQVVQIQNTLDGHAMGAHGKH
jgi:ketosteroid isomerase-like protein